MSYKSRRLLAKLVRAVAVPYSSSELQLLYSVARLHWERLEERYLLSGSPPAIADLRLLHDTGTPGDNITSDVTLTGRVTNDGPTSALPVEFDVNWDGAVDGTVYSGTDAAASFIIDLSNDVFAPGPVSVRVRARELADDGFSYAYGAWSTLTFTYSTASAVGGENQHSIPASAANADFVGGRMDQNVPAPTSIGSTNFSGGSVMGGKFDGFETRFNDPGFTNAWSDGASDSQDYYTSDSSGTYHYISSYLFNAQYDYYSDYYNWHFSRNFTESYSLITEFTGNDGTTWWRSQNYDHNYWLTSSGHPTDSSYYGGESQHETYSFSWSDPYTSNHSKSYGSSGEQLFSFTASGGSSTDEYGGSTSDELSYDAYGSDSYSDGGSDSTGSGANSSYSGGGGSGVSHWHFNSHTSAGTSPTGSNQNISFSYDRDTSDYWSQYNSSKSDGTTASGGISNHTVAQATASLTGSKISYLHLDGYNNSGGGANASSVYRYYNETLHDKYTTTASKTSDINDNSLDKVSVISKLTSSSGSNRTRDLFQSYEGTTNSSNGTVTFSDYTSGSNKLISDWTTSNNAHVTGTDTTVSGTTRTMLSDRGAGDSGTSNYSFTSSGTEVRDATGAITKTGSSTTTSDLTGKTNWNTHDHGEVNGTTTSISGAATTTTIIVGSDDATSGGTGSYNAKASGTATFNPGGSIATEGSSSHLASANGTTSEAHNYTTTVIESGSPSSGKTRESTSISTLQSNQDSKFSSSASGKGTYSNGTASTSEDESRDEYGNSSSFTTQDDEVDETDSRPGVPSTTAHVTSHSDQTVIGTTSFTSNQSTGDDKGKKSFSTGHTEKAQGYSYGFTSSDSVLDTAYNANKIDTTSHSTSHSENNPYGNYSESLTETSQLEAGGGYSSTRTHLLTDLGGYDGYDTSTSSSHSVDTSTDGITVDFVSGGDTTSNTTGSYTKIDSQKESTSATGEYKSDSETLNTTEDGGDTLSHSSTTTNVNGVDSSSPLITTTVSSNDQTSSTDTGSYTASTSLHTTTNIEAGKTTKGIAQNDDRNEKGTTIWGHTSGSNSITQDDSTPGISIHSSGGGGSQESGNGKYSIIDHFESVSGPLGNTSHRTHNQTTSGASTWNNNSGSFSTIDDIATKYVTRHSTTQSNSGGNGTGTYGTLDNSEDHVTLLSSYSSTFESADTTHDGYSYFYIYSYGNENQDIPADPNSSTQSTTQSNSNSSQTRSGNGTTSDSSHSETATKNGVFVHSLNTSQSTENGTAYDYQNIHNEGTVNQNAFDEEGFLDSSSNGHHIYDSTSWGNTWYHYDNGSSSETFANKSNHSLSTNNYNGSGSGHSQTSSSSDGGQIIFGADGSIVNIDVIESAGSNSDTGYSDGSHDESESLPDGSSSSYKSAWRSEGSNFSRENGSSHDSSLDSFNGGTRHATTSIHSSESSSGTMYNNHFEETSTESDAGGTSIAYDSTDSSGEQGKMSWSDSQETHGTFDSTTDGKRHSSNDFTSSEKGSGTYSATSSTTNNNGAVHSKSSEQQSTTSTFQSSDKASGTYQKTAPDKDGSVQQIHASDSRNDTVSNGHASNSLSHSLETFADHSYIEITSTFNSESADLISDATTDSSAFINYPTGTYDGTKTASISSYSIETGDGNYSDSTTYSKTDNNGDWNSTSHTIHSESNDQTWSQGTDSSTQLEKETIAGAKISATTHDNSTDYGGGNTSDDSDWTTVASGNAATSTSSMTGNAHRSVNVSGFNSWDKGSDTSSSATTPYETSPDWTRTSTSSSHSHDVGFGDFSVSGTITRIIDASGDHYSGGIIRDTHGYGDTANTKSRSWTNTKDTETYYETNTDKLTTGDVGDYTKSSHQEVTVNPDGTTTANIPPEIRHERHYALLQTDYTMSRHYTAMGDDGEHTYTADTTTSNITKAGNNKNSETGLTDHTYYSKYSSTQSTTDHTDHSTDDITTKYSTTETRTRTDDEVSGTYTAYTTTYDNSYDKVETKSSDYEDANYTSSSNSTDHDYNSSHLQETYDGAGGSITSSSINGGDKSSHNEWTSNSYKSSSDGYGDDSSSWETTVTTTADVNADRSTELTGYSYSETSKNDHHSHSHSHSWNATIKNDYGGYGAYVDTTSDSTWGGTHELTKDLTGASTVHVHVHDTTYSNGKVTDPSYENDSDYEVTPHNFIGLSVIGGDWHNVLLIAIDQADFYSDAIIQSIYAGMQDLFTLLINPDAYVDGLVADVYQFFVDGRAADGFFGTVDKLVDFIPFHQYFIPTIGVKYGHYDAYQVGQGIGLAIGIAGSIMIGNVAMGGLVGCGTFLQRAAQVYNVLDSASGMISATQHIMNGTAGWGDALAFLPLVTFGASKMAGLGGCFVAGTLVIVDGEVTTLTAGVTVREEDASEGRVSWTMLGAAAGACFIGVLGYRRLRRKDNPGHVEDHPRRPRPLRLRPAPDDPGVLVGTREHSTRVPWRGGERAGVQRDAPFSTASTTRVSSLFHQVPSDSN